MQSMNSGWNKFVRSVIANVGWLIVLVLSLVTILLTQLGTNHKSEQPSSFESLFQVYEEFGRVKWVTPVNQIEVEEDWWTLGDYFREEELKLNASIAEAELKLKNPELLPTEKVRLLAGIDRDSAALETLDKQYEIVASGKLGERSGINTTTLVLKQMQNMKFEWVAEYRADKILKVASTDVFSWILVLVIAFSAIVIKIQGNKTGKISGFKIVWSTTARHATLSEKIAPRSVEAEDICIRMNDDELKRKRITRLQYASLNYEDVFLPDGTFRSNPNFIEIDLITYRNRKGKVIYKENPHQKKMLKRQKKAVRELRKFRIKEVHTYILLEAKAEARERFDFGETLKTRDRRTTITNVATSILTALPMFTAASIFVYTGDKDSLVLGVAGIIVNLGSLLFNMFGSYDYIINTWSPNIVKKCDILLSIAIELGVADEIDKNWDARIEDELHKSNAK